MKYIADDNVFHTHNGEPNLNYLCEGFKQFYRHIDPYMQFMVKELKAERSPSNIRFNIDQIKAAEPA